MSKPSIWEPALIPLALVAVVTFVACDEPGEDIPTTTPLFTVGPSPPGNLTLVPNTPMPSVGVPGPKPEISVTWGPGMPTAQPMQFGDVFVPVPPDVRISMDNPDFGRLLGSFETFSPSGALDIWTFELSGRSRIQFDERGLISAEIAPEDAADFQPTLDAIAQLGPQHDR